MLADFFYNKICLMKTTKVIMTVVIMIMLMTINSAAVSAHRRRVIVSSSVRKMTTPTIISTSSASSVSMLAFLGIPKQKKQNHHHQHHHHQQQQKQLVSKSLGYSLQQNRQQILLSLTPTRLSDKTLISRRWNSRYKLTTPSRTSLSATESNTSNNDDRNEKQIISTTNDIVNKDELLKEYSNKNNIRDQVVSAISSDGGIKVTVCTCRNMVNDLMIQHTMTPISTQAFGRTVICGLLMANGIQEEQSVQISIRTQDGPLRGVVTIVTGRGEVRGYVGTPMLGDDWSLEDAVGRIGSVQIVKNHPSWPRPYNGITAIRYGDIDRDIGIYLAESEQRSCALAAACSIQDILCHAAGGYLVEILPDCTDDVKQQVEMNLAKLVELDGGDTLPTNLLLRGMTPIDICSVLLHNLNMQPLQEIKPILKCDCNENRLIRALRLLPSSDVDEILIQQQQIEARCEFCGKVYRMGPDEVREKMATAIGDPSKDDDNNFQ